MRKVEHLGTAVRRALEQRQWTFMKAAEKTGLAASTVHNMAEGWQPSEKTLRRFVEAIDEVELIDSWLWAAGIRYVRDPEALGPAAPSHATDDGAVAQPATSTHVRDDRALYEAGGLDARFDGGTEGILLLKDAEQLSPTDRDEIASTVECIHVLGRLGLAVRAVDLGPRFRGALRGDATRHSGHPGGSMPAPPHIGHASASAVGSTTCTGTTSAPVARLSALACTCSTARSGSGSMGADTGGVAATPYCLSGHDSSSAARWQHTCSNACSGTRRIALTRPPDFLRRAP